MMIALVEERNIQWMKYAGCIGYSSDLFFPEKNGEGNYAGPAAYKEARAICSLCIVRSACLDFALGIHCSEDYGMWGGTTPRERVAIRKARSLTPVSTPANTLAYSKDN